MDWITEVTTLASLAILGLATILTLLVQQLGWPKRLVRHYVQMHEPEIRSIVSTLLEEQLKKKQDLELARRKAIQEAGRYEVPSDRVKRLIPSVISIDEVGVRQRFAAEVPFFVDFMGGSTDDKFAEECSLILASYLRLNRDDIANFDAIIGIKAGAPLIAAALARRLQMPLLLYRGRSRVRRDVANLSSYEAFDGDREFLAGPVLLVDDSTTGGSMMIDCAGAVRACGGEVKAALVLAEIVGRNGRERMSRNGIPLISVVSITQDYLNSLEGLR